MSNPNLAKYTTTVPARKSIGEIHDLLAEFGANRIFFDQDESRRTVSVSFLLTMANGTILPFRLPIKPDAVHEYLWRQYKADTTYRRRKEKIDFADQAYNVAWRIMKEYVHNMVSIIQTEQVRPEEVFLPYVVCDELGTTLADCFQAGKLNRLLPTGAGNNNE
jgi:hypothetical protein